MMLAIGFVEGLRICEIIDKLYDKPYLAIYAEIVSSGLPLAITLLCREDLRMYGLRREGLVKSIILSLLLVIVKGLLVIAEKEIPVESCFNLKFPYNVWYAVLGVFAYGPLEVFLVIWLIVNTDLTLKSSEKLLSPGLLIMVTIFGLSHLILSPKAGILNAFSITVTFLVLGLIFKYTKNSVGPMIAWTLLNGQVLCLLTSCLC